MKTVIFVIILFIICAPWRARAQALPLGLPVVDIRTADSAKIAGKEDYIRMDSFVLTDPSNPLLNVSRSGPQTGDSIRGRGNDSWFNPYALKKSYRVRFGGKVPLLGLTAAKNWILHAQYRDPTLLFNAVAFELGNRFKMPFNHSVNFVDLYLNGGYMGVYLLTEHNEAGAGRVDIDELEGWLVEFDEYYDKEPKFRTADYALPIMIKSPKADPLDIRNPAYYFVRRDLNALTAAAVSRTFPESGYRNMIDTDNFIDYIMVQEIVNNRDFQYPLSVFVYKDKGGLIKMGPLWDFDAGYGAVDAYGGRLPLHPFFKRLFDDPAFLAKYKARWNEKYGDIVSIQDYIDETASKLALPAMRNFREWWYKTLPPWTAAGHIAEPNDFENSVASLKDWYLARVSYLNSEINKVEAAPAGWIFEIQPQGYDGVPPQKFTIVSNGEISGLASQLKAGRLSGFTVDGEWSRSAGSAAGYYFASIKAKPKNDLPVGQYNDVLVMSGTAGGKRFAVEAPLRFVVSSGAPPVTAGPNPVGRRSGEIVRIFRDGARVESTELAVYDAIGNLVNRVRVIDKGAGYTGPRQIGAWNLTNQRGNPVAAGTYLLRGTVTVGGVKEAVSLKIGVR